MAPCLAADCICVATVVTRAIFDTAEANRHGPTNENKHYHQSDGPTWHRYVYVSHLQNVNEAYTIKDNYIGLKDKDILKIPGNC